MKYHWIDESIEIDFPVPKFIQNLIKELEEYDLEENDVMYIDRSECLENVTKDLVYDRVLTAKQRDTLCRKYG